MHLTATPHYPSFPLVASKDTCRHIADHVTLPDSPKLQIQCSLQVHSRSQPMSPLCGSQACNLLYAGYMHVTCSLHAGYMQFTCLLRAGSCWSGQCQQRCDKCWSTAAVCAREDGGGHLSGSERHCHGYQQPQNIWSVPAVSGAYFWAQA